MYGRWYDRLSADAEDVDRTDLRTVALPQYLGRLLFVVNPNEVGEALLSLFAWHLNAESLLHAPDQLTILKVDVDREQSRTVSMKIACSDPEVTEPGEIPANGFFRRDSPLPTNPFRGLTLRFEAEGYR